jgi:PAS domain S-box-containing protein
LKITLVAPYQDFGRLFSQVAEHYRQRLRKAGRADDFEFQVCVCFDQAALRDMYFDCDAIIARAHSANILSDRENFVPVVNMLVQTVDVIRCIKNAWAKYGKRRIIFPGTYTMVNQAYQVSELIDVDLEILEMPSTIESEVDLIYQRITDHDAIIIGGNPVCNRGRELNFKTAVVESGEEAMALALEDARRIAEAARHEAEKAQEIRTILDSQDDAIISVDTHGLITYFNSAAERILQLNREQLLLRKASEALSNQPLTEFIESHPDCQDEILRCTASGGEILDLSAGKRSISLEGKRIGSVITLQYISRLQDSEAKLRSKLSEKDHKAKHRFYEILGSAPATQFAVRQAQKYSQVEASVLITGKSGTGKELFAQSMHNASRRKSFPFVAINCAAIPESLLESELFGYVEGAFTGAVRGGKMGLIEMAHRGTLFLDEISELPLSLQARLLRVLQEKEIRRIGHDKVINVDIRVFSATNRNLQELVAQGKFREDLYYRLDVLRLELPALSERREDIPPLCRHYINIYAKRNNMPAPEFTSDALEFLSSLPWNGNVRELCNVCQRLIVLCDGSSVTVQSVKEAIHDNGPNAKPAERIMIEDLMAAGLTKAEIASRMGMERTTLWRHMKKLGF